MGFVYLLFNRLVLRWGFAAIQLIISFIVSSLLRCTFSQYIPHYYKEYFITAFYAYK
eukprot:UN03735